MHAEKVITLRIGVEEHAAIGNAAHKDRISVNKWIRRRCGLDDLTTSNIAGSSLVATYGMPPGVGVEAAPAAAPEYQPAGDGVVADEGAE